METESAKIASVQIENFMRIKFAHIDFPGEGIRTGGENEAGKTSIARAIYMAFAGKKGVPIDPVTHGAKSAQVKVELDNGLVLKATVKPDRSYSVELLDADGVPARRVQERLDEFNIRYGFWPQDFMALEPKAKADLLLNLAGVDLDQFSRRHEAAYAKRTAINRDVARVAGELQSISYDSRVGEVQISIEALVSQITDAQKVGERYRSLISTAEIAVNESDKKVREAERLEAQARTLRDQAENLINQATARKLEAEQLQLPDIETLQAELSTATSTNEKVRQNILFAKLRKERSELEAKVDALTAEIEQVRSEKEQTLREARFPIEGLGFSEAGVTLNDVPFEQASDAKQWFAAMSIGMAMKPKLKLVYVRNGGMMTVNTRQEVYKFCKEHDFQLLMEIPGDQSDVTLLMEDGEVAEVRTEKLLGAA